MTFEAQTLQTEWYLVYPLLSVAWQCFDNPTPPRVGFHGDIQQVETLWIQSLFPLSLCSVPAPHPLMRGMLTVWSAPIQLICTTLPYVIQTIQLICAIFNPFDQPAQHYSHTWLIFVALFLHYSTPACTYHPMCSSLRCQGSVFASQSSLKSCPEMFCNTTLVPGYQHLPLCVL